MVINRRDFLTTVGIAGGGAALALGPQAGKKVFRKLWGEDWVEVPIGLETRINSICQQCPGGCGITVRLVGNRAVKIDGNSLYPINRGGLCPKGQSGLQALYGPDRIRHPLKRVGNRGSDKWEPISWDEAIKIVVTKLQEIKKARKSHSLGIMAGETKGLMRALLERFLLAFGSPNYISVPENLSTGPLEAFYLMQGLKEGLVYDLEESNYILSFGVDLLQSYWSPVQVLKAFGRLRRERPERARIVQIEPRQSVTATKADEWVPIKPGTEGALALAIAHLIIKEGLQDDSFIQNYTLGFESWTDSSQTRHLGFKDLILKEDYTPGIVSEITGVPVNIIIRLAREFATTKPAVAIGLRADVPSQMAVHALNALVGSIDTPGGVLVARDIPYPALPPIKAGEGAQKPPLAKPAHGEYPLAEYVFQGFQERVLKGHPYKLEVIFLYQTNPLFSSFDPERFVQVLNNIPFIVSFSSVMDETTRLADLVLPDHNYLEKWQDDPVHSLRGYPIIGLRKPVVEPLYDTRHTGDVIIQIAHTLGGTLSQAFPWKDFPDALQYYFHKLFEEGRGDLVGQEFEEAWSKLLARGGWRAPSYQSMDEFWQGLQERGGWWDPIYYYRETGRVFKTPSGKFEFYSQLLKEKLRILGKTKLKDLGFQTQGDRFFLPHWEAPTPKTNEEEYPLVLNLYQPLVFAGLIDTNQPFLQDITSIAAAESWDSWVEINPETAKKYGISYGERIWIESPRGKLRFRARLIEGTMPEVVNVALGFGHKALGRWAKNIGENPLWIMEEYIDPLTGRPIINNTTRVKIYRA
jgi:anaerobic selenocysteine-containing dehydrogenase